MLQCVLKKEYWSLKRRINFCEFKSSELTPICNGDGFCSLDGMRWTCKSIGSWESWKENKFLFYLWHGGRKKFRGLQYNWIFFVPVFEKVTLLLDFGITEFWRVYRNIGCWTSCHGLYPSEPWSLFPYVCRPCRDCVNSPVCFCYLRTVKMAYEQLKNGVLLENASVTTLSVVFLCSGCLLYSRPAYLPCEKCWRTV
jgi:hypothetical protein